MQDVSLSKQETLIKDLEIKPQFRRLILKEDSSYWDEDLVERCGGGIYGVYVYDFREETFCCELTPSYYLYLVEYFPEITPEEDEEREQLLNKLGEVAASDDYNMYVHCSVIDRIPLEESSSQLVYETKHQILVDYQSPDDPDDEWDTYQEALDKAIERAR